MPDQLEHQLKAYFESPTISLRNTIVESNLGLARSVAHSFARSLDYDEAFSLASIGLIKGVERYNPSKSNGATTGFLRRYCRGEILHYLRDKSSLIKVPRNRDQISIMPETYIEFLVAKTVVKPSVSRWAIICKFKYLVLGEKTTLEPQDLEALVSQLVELSA